ncbi:flagellar export chaperone FlgN [Maridesulfovibrio hydrothermalis]|uniref:FlgN family protein n=1 Tax=Maridesulfovibrio hydrothermalis AM13 = DSM 14728 TaxID=1121451 RepID=L0RB33_9BACT|nr:flagellar export chaperone FlgN [Maridesulfovibrio hydrothermalis]CCO23988.1 FlgN family protein [Maridesulfovibrio hydrothermalis AM13 = DSM 14728]
MIKLIQENLDRQSKAVLLLSMLLQEEFSLLMNKDPQGVTRVELVIQELMRQIAAERMSLRNFVQRIDPSAVRLGQVLPAIADDQREKIEKILARIDEYEQKCGVQATKNHQLAQALLDQSSSMLDFLHREITPKEQNVYSARGRYSNPSPQATLINGRL